MRKLALLVLFCGLPLCAFAQSSVDQQAREALAKLDDAAQRLEQVDTARDRVRALTDAISAHEEGLAALRSGLLRVSAYAAELSARLEGEEHQIAALIAVLQRLGDEPSPVALLHPAGPTGSARAGMLLAEVVPALNEKAAALRTDLRELQLLRELQNDSIRQLEAGLGRLQTAREELNLAISDRTALPKRFVNDPVREAILIASAKTLEQFVKGLDRVAVDQVAPAPNDLDSQKGSLELPVQGQVLLPSGAPDAAGISRPGIVFSVLPGALVTSPVAVTIRYTGPLLDFGQVIIVEPKADVLFIFAGLEKVFGAAGDVVTAGTPLGAMGGSDGKNVAELSTDGELTGAQLSETLYIEVRQNNSPEDPDLWFAIDKDG